MQVLNNRGHGGGRGVYGNSLYFRLSFLKYREVVGSVIIEAVKAHRSRLPALLMPLVLTLVFGPWKFPLNVEREAMTLKGCVLDFISRVGFPFNWFTNCCWKRSSNSLLQIKFSRLFWLQVSKPT